MENNHRVTQLIYEALQEVAPPVQPGPDTVLIGASQALDSLGFVNLIVTVEQKMEQTFQKKINLFDIIIARDDARLTLAQLAQYVADLVESFADEPQQAPVAESI